MDLKKYYCISEPLKLYAKKKYNEKVKTNSYEINFQSQPFDNDVRKPKLNWFLPHYKQLGYHDCSSTWITTTQDMLSQPFTHKETPNPNKKLLNYYTFHDELQYLENIKNPCPSEFAVNEYITTMQSSYKLQGDLKMERLAMAKTPFFRNRRFRVENPRESSNKFFDDDQTKEIELLQKYKPNRQISYNFMTGLMSDDSPVSTD